MRRNASRDRVSFLHDAYTVAASEPGLNTVGSLFLGLNVDSCAEKILVRYIETFLCLDSVIGLCDTFVVFQNV